MPNLHNSGRVGLNCLFIPNFFDGGLILNALFFCSSSCQFLLSPTKEPSFAAALFEPHDSRLVEVNHNL
jgi:hypothetical protein